MASFHRAFLMPLMFAALFSTVLSPASAEAEPQAAKRIGRLPDGRAYRIDQSGFRLVDQVAELQVSIDEMRRQLEAADNELKRKDKTIAALTSGKPLPECAPVKESNLIAAAGSKKAADPKDPPNCNELVSNLYLRVAKLESELQNARVGKPTVLPAAARRECPEAPTCPESKVCDYQSEENPLWDQVQRLQSELMKGPSAESYSAERVKRAEVEKELTTSSMQLAQKQEEVTQLEQMLADSRQQVARLQQERDSEIEAAVEQAEGRTRAAMTSTTKPRQAAAEPAVRAAAPDTLAARRLQSRFTKQLSEIQTLIGRRKDLLDDAKARGKYYDIEPLLTNNGTSLDSLRKQVAELDWSSNSATIADGLKEIKTVLNKDIAAIKRMR